LWWRSKREASLPKLLGPLWEVLLWIVGGALAVLLLYLMMTNYEIGMMVVGVVFLASYLFVVAYAILREAAREVAQRPAPVGPMRERLHDFKDEWQRAVAAPDTVYLPSPTGPYSYSPIAPQTDPFAALARSDNMPLPGQNLQAMQPAAPGAEPTTAPLPAASTPRSSSRKETVTYGVEPFLSDSLNPIFAKDMRSGLFGKAHYFFRFAYGITIFTEVLMLFFIAVDSSSNSLYNLAAAWGQIHLVLLMAAGAFFGARGLAPEREQQTLPQLLTVPLHSSTIIGGKMMAVMAYTFYVFLMALPLMLLLPMLGELPWGMALSFLGLELVFGAFAAAWGLFCSIECLTVRRALGWALGGILVLMLGGPLLGAVVMGLSNGSGDSPVRWLNETVSLLLPLPALEGVLNLFNASGLRPSSNGSDPITLSVTFATLLIYATLTALLLFITARSFKHYAQTV
jgi:ABC-type transport system involved in multi-copper enzyme maturation permease subunit